MTDPGPEVRLSDTERSQAIDNLFAGHRDGRIDLDELDRRLQLVHAAQTVGELSGPLADLPGPRPWSPRAQQVERIEATGGFSRTGRWTVSRWTRIEQHVDGGGIVHVDLSEAEVPFPRIDVELLLGVGGRARFVLPPGATADLSGTTGRGGPARTDVPSAPGTTGPHLVVAGSAGKRAWIRVGRPGRLRWWETF